MSLYSRKYGKWSFQAFYFSCCFGTCSVFVLSLFWCWPVLFIPSLLCPSLFLLASEMFPYVLFVSMTQVTRAWCWPETFLRDEHMQLLLVFLLQMWEFNGRFHRHFSSGHHSEIISCIWCYNVTIIGQKKALRWSTTPT